MFKRRISLAMAVARPMTPAVGGHGWTEVGPLASTQRGATSAVEICGLSLIISSRHGRLAFQKAQQSHTTNSGCRSEERLQAFLVQKGFWHNLDATS